jgi:hypothetical protein
MYHSFQDLTDQQEMALESTKTILVGPSGSGKTTVIRQKIFNLVQNNKKVYVFCPKSKAWEYLNGTETKLIKVILWEDFEDLLLDIYDTKKITSEQLEKDYKKWKRNWFRTFSKFNFFKFLKHPVFVDSMCGKNKIFFEFFNFILSVEPKSFCITLDSNILFRNIWFYSPKVLPFMVNLNKIFGKREVLDSVYKPNHHMFPLEYIETSSDKLNSKSIVSNPINNSIIPVTKNQIEELPIMESIMEYFEKVVVEKNSSIQKSMTEPNMNKLVTEPICTKSSLTNLNIYDPSKKEVDKISVQKITNLVTEDVLTNGLEKKHLFEVELSNQFFTNPTGYHRQEAYATMKNVYRVTRFEIKKLLKMYNMKSALIAVNGPSVLVHHLTVTKFPIDYTILQVTDVPYTKNLIYINVNYHYPKLNFSDETIRYQTCSKAQKFLAELVINVSV